ncbi:MAG TPA: flavodoxin domain-containing protein [Flavitalea sp.]|nr:flavodoxin domain-containing protein [Flavitalea sp.]
MLTPAKLKLVQDIISSSSKEELIWLNGYLSGLVSSVGEQTETAAPAKVLVDKITIAYGSETGNSKKLATDFASKAKKSGINAKLVSLEQYRLTDLPKEKYFFTVISTQGEGEPPGSAKKFYDHIHQNDIKLSQLKFGVLALGDTSYPLFCKAGEDVDTRLSKLGGERIVPLQKCDTDYEGDSQSWFTALMQQLQRPAGAPQPEAQVVVKKSTGKKLYIGSVLSNTNLNDIGSGKQTHHIEIAAEDLDYQPGDSIGIIPHNPLSVVEAILSITGANPDKVLSFRNEEHTLLNLLKNKLNIVFLPERVVNEYARIVQQQIPQTKIGLLDLLKIYPVRDAEQFEEAIAILEPITPRLYSIASSLEAHSGEVHLTVARDSFVINGEKKYGLCSDMLCHLPENAELSFYVHKNNQFRLPAPDKDVIMIGPGTGIAPFRAFLWERDATGGAGRNWLFFGDQHFITDFLYQTEIQNWVETGTLTNVSLAFSRDQQEKIYVQHKMLKQGAELYQWIEQGGYIYICGAKDPMSVDVEKALTLIIKQHGGKDSKGAEAYLDKLKEEGRYLKDVY